jgi:hypothetical protein
MSKTIQEREISIAARAERIKRLEKRMAEQAALTDAALRAIRRL